MNEVNRNEKANRLKTQTQKYSVSHMPTLLILMGLAPPTPLNSNSLQRFQGGWFKVTMSIANRNEKANRLKTL